MTDREKKQREILESILHQIYGYSQARHAPNKEIDYNDKDKKVIYDLIDQALTELFKLDAMPKEEVGRRCHSCGEILSSYCPRCKRQWES